MTIYRNLSGHSGISAYKIAATHIAVQFTGGNIYLYTYDVTGKTHVENMKKLAVSGSGLATYISRYVHDKYEAKI